MARAVPSCRRIARSSGLACFAALCLVTVFAPGRASALASCATLESAVTSAASGATIHISGTQFGCRIVYSGKSLTFQGDAPGAGFDGGNGTDSIISSSGGGAQSFRDLTFRNGNAASIGGAVRVEGASSVEVLRSRFFANNSGNVGGAAYLNTNGTGAVVIRDSVFGSTSPGLGNATTSSAGAVYAQSNDGPIVVERSTFAGNTANYTGALTVSGQKSTLTSVTVSGNTATSGTGGAGVFSKDETRITSSKFVGNRVNSTAPSGSARTGGGLQASSGASGQIVQTGNLVQDNELLYAQTTADPSFPSGGGGEFVTGNFVSRGDRFIHNTAKNIVAGGAETEGGGLFVFGCVSVPGAPRTVATASNLVAAGNALQGGDEGAGVYVGCGKNPVDFTLNDSTIAGNTGGSPLDGGSLDTLKSVNSIVSAGGTAPAITGFASRALAFSDACAAGGAAAPGIANFCADPRLVNPSGGDVHQTTRSPTRDRGSNARVPAGLATDFEGGARITDAQPDGYAIVDIGADETATGKLALSALRVSPSRFRLTGRHRGTTIAFTISGPSPVRFSVARLRKGRAPRAVGSFLHTARTGRNHVRFTGRIGRTKLAPGRYRLSLKAKNRLNNRSNVVSATLVVRG